MAWAIKYISLKKYLVMVYAPLKKMENSEKGVCYAWKLMV